LRSIIDKDDVDQRLLVAMHRAAAVRRSARHRVADPQLSGARPEVASVRPVR
jgi:hypothetical protein